VPLRDEIADALLLVSPYDESANWSNVEKSSSSSYDAIDLSLYRPRFELEFREGHLVLVNEDTLFSSVGFVPFIDEGFSGTIFVVGVTAIGVATTS